MPMLHVVMPVFNEPETLGPCLRRLGAAPRPQGWDFRVHLVDDHSTPEAYAAAAGLARALARDGHAITLQRHAVNRGKGAALRSGFDAVLEESETDEDLLTIQDADLEYDPRDLAALMAPILAGRCRVTLGSRWNRSDGPGTARRMHAWGNRALTRLSNLMTGYRLHDMECCYKMFTVEVLRRLRPMLSEDRFGIEPQIVAALARLGEAIEEVPVRYEPRGRSAGKKIGWRDGIRAVWVIARERLR